MATYVRDYHLTINQTVAIDAPNEQEAARIFVAIEHGDRAWYYLKNEVFDHMGEYVGNNVREVVTDIEPYIGVYNDEELAEDVIDYSAYLSEE